MSTEQKLREALDEIEAVLKGAHSVMETVSGLERRVGPVGSHARGYTHKITMALKRLEVVAAALTQPPPPEQQENEADELLRNLGLDPDRYRTESGFINHLKVKAAILYPEKYPQLVAPEQQAPQGKALYRIEQDGTPKPICAHSLNPGDLLYAAPEATKPETERDELIDRLRWFVNNTNNQAEEYIAKAAALLSADSKDAVSPAHTVPFDVEFAATYLDGVMEDEHPEIQGEWAKIHNFLSGIGKDQA